MFVGIDDVVPDKEADGEEHSCVQVFPVRIRPPSVPMFLAYITTQGQLRKYIA